MGGMAGWTKRIEGVEAVLEAFKADPSPSANQFHRKWRRLAVFIPEEKDWVHPHSAMQTWREAMGDWAQLEDGPGLGKIGKMGTTRPPKIRGRDQIPKGSRNMGPCPGSEDSDPPAQNKAGGVGGPSECTASTDPWLPVLSRGQVGAPQSDLSLPTGDEGDKQVWIAWTFGKTGSQNNDFYQNLWSGEFQARRPMGQNQVFRPPLSATPPHETQWRHLFQQDVDMGSACASLLRSFGRLTRH